MQNMLAEKDVGNYLGWTIAAMRQNRYLQRGPTYYKIGKRVWYRKEDLELFIHTRRMELSAPVSPLS